MRILITGGTGYLGRHLIARLLENPANEIHVLARNEASLPENVFLHRADIGSYAELENIMQRVNPALVYHLAGDTRRSKDETLYGALFNTNVIGTAHMLRALCLRRSAALIAVGSFEEYGPIATPFIEELIAPRTVYGITKAAASAMVSSVGKVSIPTAVLRFPILYGSDVRADSFLGVLANSIAEHKQMPLASGTETRDFLHIDDALDALLHTAEEIKRCRGEIINICSGVETSLIHVVALAEEITGRQGIAGVGMIPERPHEQRSYVGSFDKAKRLLGWEPKISLKDGLAALLDSTQRR